MIYSDSRAEAWMSLLSVAASSALFESSGKFPRAKARSVLPASPIRLLISWLALLADVVADRCLVHLADGFGEVAVRPQTAPPKKLGQIRKFLAQHPARAALEPRHDRGHAVLGAYLDHQVEVVGQDAQFMHLPAVHLAGFVEQRFQTDGQGSFEYPFALLGHEHQVKAQPVRGMRTGPITRGFLRLVGLVHAVVWHQTLLGDSPAYQRPTHAFDRPRGQDGARWDRASTPG